MEKARSGQTECFCTINRQSPAAAVSTSAIIDGAEGQRKLKIVSAVYRLANGRVEAAP
jgi:hypothetical protein